MVRKNAGVCCVQEDVVYALSEEDAMVDLKKRAEAAERQGTGSAAFPSSAGKMASRYYCCMHKMHRPKV